MVCISQTAYPAGNHADYRLPTGVHVRIEVVAGSAGAADLVLKREYTSVLAVHDVTGMDALSHFQTYVLATVGFLDGHVFYLH